MENEIPDANKVIRGGVILAQAPTKPWDAVWSNTEGKVNVMIVISETLGLGGTKVIADNHTPEEVCIFLISYLGYYHDWYLSKIVWPIDYLRTIINNISDHESIVTVIDLHDNTIIDFNRI